MSTQMSNIAIMLPTWVGDACMATPTLKALRGGFPDAKITCVARPVIAGLLDGLQADSSGRLFDNTIAFQKTNLSSRLALAAKLRKAKLDAIVLLTNSFWSAAVAKLGRCRTIVGYDRDARGWLLSQKVAVPKSAAGHSRIAQIDYYLQLVESAGCQGDDRRMSLAVAQADQQCADDMWQEFGWDEQTPTLVINNNAATQPDRMWPADRVLDLSKAVTDRYGWNVLLHCGPGERDMANAIAKRAADERIRSMGRREQLPIGLSKAVMRKAAVVVSSDSGPRHIAVASDRPVVSLFSSATHPAWTKTYNEPEIALRGANGDDGIAKISKISVDEVLAAIEEARSLRSAA